MSDAKDLIVGEDTERLTRWVSGEDDDPRHTDPAYKGIEPQLYNLDVAPYESLMISQFNVWQQCPAVVKELTGLMNKYKCNGRSVSLRETDHRESPRREEP